MGILALCAAGGGASRTDVQSLVFLRPGTVLAIAALCALRGPWDAACVRVPALCLATLALVVLAQLVPLPPALWTALPGHARFVAAANLLHRPQPWAPVSLTPDLGWSSLFDLMVPAAVLTGYARLTSFQRHRLLDVVVVLIGLSVLVAIVQIGTGMGYLYRLTSYTLPVGLFSNRNHQATLLAIALPVLRVWSSAPDAGASTGRLRSLAAAALAILVVVLILLTGSRAGLFLSMLMAVVAGLIAGLPFARERRGRSMAIAGSIVGLLALAAALTVATGRSLTIGRLLATDVFADQRAMAGPVVWRLISDYLPWGSGFGSFDQVFRIGEPDAALSGTFFNHAHDDPAELLLTGGLPAALVLAAFVAWWGRRAVDAFLRLPRRDMRTVLLARAGAAVTFGIGLASLVDYPLRTPLMAAVFALGCAWLSSGGEREGNPVLQGEWLPTLPPPSD